MRHTTPKEINVKASSRLRLVTCDHIQSIGTIESSVVCEDADATSAVWASIYGQIITILLKNAFLADKSACYTDSDGYYTYRPIDIIFVKYFDQTDIIPVISTVYYCLDKIVV